MREVCLAYYKSWEVQRAQGRVEGTAWEGPFSAEVSAKLMSMRWGCGLEGQRQVRQGGPVVALAKDPKSFRCENLHQPHGDRGNRRTCRVEGRFCDVFPTHHGGNQPWNALAANGELMQRSWAASHEEQELAWTHKQYLGSTWTHSTFLAGHKQQCLQR